MTDRPIIFSGPMVRALLEGRKTQTRRLVKPPAPQGAQDAGVIGSAGDDDGLWFWLDSPDLLWASTLGEPFRCPYGVPGDRLWVRETFTLPNDHVTIYRANWREDAQARGLDNIPADDAAIRWRPSIHMPRWASRLTLTLTDVRVQRLQEISEADAEAEGVEGLCCWDGAGGVNVKIENKVVGNWIAPRRRDVFETLWSHLHGADSWNANPWVWALTFEVAR